LFEATINVNETLQNIKVTFAKVDTIPTNTEPPKETEKVFKYLQITLSNGKDKVKQGNLKFKVEKTWIEQNNLNKKLVRLYRYTNQWDELQTNIIEEDATYVYYEAITPGFSYFKISATTPPQEVKIQPTTQPNIAATTSANNNSQDQTKTQTQNITKVDNKQTQPENNKVLKDNLNNTTSSSKNIFIFLGLAIIIIIAGLSFALIKRKHAAPHPDEDKAIILLEDYLKKVKERNINIDLAKENLLKKGWNKSLVEKAIKDFEKKK